MGCYTHGFPSVHSKNSCEIYGPIPTTQRSNNVSWSIPICMPSCVNSKCAACACWKKCLVNSVYRSALQIVEAAWKRQSGQTNSGYRPTTQRFNQYVMDSVWCIQWDTKRHFLSSSMKIIALSHPLDVHWSSSSKFSRSQGSNQNEHPPLPTAS